MPTKPLEPGDPVKLGRFELLARLGEGGQGVVYLGRGPQNERVAVKVLRSTADADVLQRLARELDAVHQVQPFVTAGVIEASAEGGRRYVVSEFIDGPSLQERVDTGGPLPSGDLQRLAAGTGSTQGQAAGPTIPAALAGTWKGTASMSALSNPGIALQNPIEFRFVAGARTVHENNRSCVNTLTLTKVTDTVLTFSEPGTPACVAGTVTFTRKGAGLAYRWTDHIEQNTALLHRT